MGPGSKLPQEGRHAAALGVHEAALAHADNSFLTHDVVNSGSTVRGGPTLATQDVGDGGVAAGPDGDDIGATAPTLRGSRSRLEVLSRQCAVQLKDLDRLADAVGVPVDPVRFGPERLMRRRRTWRRRGPKPERWAGLRQRPGAQDRGQPTALGVGRNRKVDRKHGAAVEEDDLGRPQGDTNAPGAPGGRTSPSARSSKAHPRRGPRSREGANSTRTVVTPADVRLASPGRRSRSLTTRE